MAPKHFEMLSGAPMGLNCGGAELIIQEHLYRSLNGAKVLLIGRQSTDIPPKAMENLLALYGLKSRAPLTIEREGSMAHHIATLAPGTPRITDESVFHSIADCTVAALDISDYEGAEIVHDLNLPIPDKYKGQYDFIFDGSCLDNIFNAPQALMTMSELLRPGGRILLHNACNSVATGYLQFSADWFIDFFAVNNYADCKSYVMEHTIGGGEPVVLPSTPEGGYPPHSGCLWHYDPLVKYGGSYGYQISNIADEVQRYVYVIAEKGEDSTSHIAPVQQIYRGPNQEPYIQAARRFRASERPLFQPRTGELFTAPSLSNYETLYPIARWTRFPFANRTPSPYPNEEPLVLPPPPFGRSIETAESMIKSFPEETGLRAQIAQLVGDCRELAHRQDALARERDQAFAERNRAFAERNEAQRSYDNVLKSRSWRLARMFARAYSKLALQ
jgi:SAM-dependent methyltransferase